MDEFEEQYTKSAQKVYRFLLRLCKDPVLAEEITQETFFRAYIHLGEFKGNCSFETWLCSIAKNIFFDEASEKKRFTSIENDLKGEDPFDGIEDRSVAISIYSCIHKLQEPYKEVFVLRVLGQLSFKEIAAIHNKSESWAKMTFYRAKAKIVEEMETANGKEGL